MKTHKVLFFIFIAVDVLLVAMALNYLGVAPKETELVPEYQISCFFLIQFLQGCA